MTARKIAPASSPPLPSDAELVSRALDGDGWAEEAIFRRHVHFVTSLAAKLLRQQSEVEDVVQDCFLQAYRDLRKLNDAERLKQWLATITVRRAQSRFRRRRMKQMLGLDTGLYDERLSDQLRVEASQEIIAELSLLDSVFDELSVSERSCWVLRKLEGYRMEEIAAIVGCSLSTVKRRIADATAKFEEYVANTETV
jgi:RNA polymerase sigma-70 factor, ECF subfamily